MQGAGGWGRGAPPLMLKLGSSASWPGYYLNRACQEAYRCLPQWVLLCVLQCSSFESSHLVQLLPKAQALSVPWDRAWALPQSDAGAMEGKAPEYSPAVCSQLQAGKLLHRPNQPSGPSSLLPRSQSPQFSGWIHSGSAQMSLFPAPQSPFLSLIPALCSVLVQAPGFS